MNYPMICGEVEKLQRTYDEADPFRLCEEMGILLLFRPFGTAPGAVKGFFLECSNVRSITVNSDLPVMIQRIIVAHELGHAVLHRNSGVCAFHDIDLYDSISGIERDANFFAAEFLLSDDDVLEVLNRDGTFFTAAAELMVPAELLDFKFRILKWKGYQITGSPMAARSNFMRDMQIPYNSDYDAC